MADGKNYYSIGKVSALCSVPIKTLRYYDKIGLLVPDYRKDESNYRYYSQDQILTLFIIRKLRLLGIPLKEIREIVVSRDSAAMGKCIQERLQGIHQAIAELNDQYSEGQMLLERLNTVDVLSFGSESGNLTLFERCARILVENQGEINRRTGPGLKGGLSFPAARAKAVAELLSMGGAHVRGEDVACKESPDARSTPRSKSEDGSDDILSILSCPNNILGLEYCKALATANSRIRPFTLKRKGCGYHDPTLILPEDGSCALPENTSSAPPEDTSRFASASALRHALSRDPAACRGFVPA